jgi:WD40 repeat protein
MKSFPHPIVRLGLDAEWPSGGTVQTYEISTFCVSPSEDIIVTGGRREGSAVYSIWDTISSYGETFVHPCKKDGCRVYHVSIDQHEIVELRTGCECGTLCRWNMSSDPHGLLEETQLGFPGSYEWWADDGSKVVSWMENRSIQLCIINTPLVQHGLWDEMELVGWQFSPGAGDKVLGYRDRWQGDTGVLAVWECASGRKLFRKSYRSGVEARFSPDGTTIACARDDVVELISAGDGTVLRRWDGILDVFDSIKFFPNGDKFLTTTYKRVYLFDGDIRREIRIDDYHFICMSPDGQRVAIIGRDYMDIFNHALDKRLEHHKLESSYRYAAYFSWNHFILFFMEREIISFYHLAYNTLTSSSTVGEFFLSPDSRHLLTFHTDRSIQEWDVVSGHRLHTFDNNFTGFSGTVKVEYAPNSSGVLVWDDYRLMILQFFVGFTKCALSVPQPSSALLAAAFFPNSDHLLIINSDRNVTTLSLNNMSARSMSPLHSKVQKIRQLVISPNEQLVAICGDLGLIIYRIGRDMYRIPLFLKHIKGAGFSPDGTNLYTLEANAGRGMLSRVDTRTWTLHRIWADHGGNLHPYEPSFTETMIGDNFFVLRNSWNQNDGRIDRFIDLSTGKQVIPPSPRIEYGDLLYQNEWIMHLPGNIFDKWSINQDYLAYIYGRKAFVVDYSSFIEQA